MSSERRRQKRDKTESNCETERSQLEAILGTDGLKRLEDLIANEKAIPPKVAVIGKAGVGKTTTINNLFNAKYHTSHTIAGTKAAQEEKFELAGGGSLTVVDMPGLGEDIDEDQKYLQIYQDILPQVDVVLYIMQANAKDMAADEEILRFVVSNAAKDQQRRIVIGLNQVDTIPPTNWDKDFNLPSPEQEINIERRCNDIIAKLSQETGISQDNIVFYSACRRYRLYDLLIAVIKAAGNLGWKFPIRPADPFEIAKNAEVREFIAQERAKRTRVKNKASIWQKFVSIGRVEDDTQ